MTKKNDSITRAELKQALTEDGDFLKPLIQLVLQEVLEAEMEEAVGAGKGERTEERNDVKNWLKKWQGRYPKLCDWVEDNIEETLTFYRWPLAHYKHLKSTNMLERINQELKRRSHVIRIFPNPASCLRLMRALTVEIHEDWIEQHRYLNMDLLGEH